MAIKLPSFRSKFRTFRIWLYLLFGFSFFLLASASAFADSYSALPGPTYGSTPSAACDAYMSIVITSPYTEISHSVSNVTSSSFSCNWTKSYKPDGVEMGPYSSSSAGSIVSVTCPSGQSIQSGSNVCSNPPVIPLGSSCDPSTGSASSDWRHSACLPSGQYCDYSGVSLTIGGITYGSGATVSSPAGGCTYDSSNPAPVSTGSPPVTPPIDPNACGVGSVSVGSTCYPTSGTQCGSLNGTTVCTGGATPTPATSVTNDASGNAVTTSVPAPSPTYSGDLLPPDSPPIPFDVYDGFTQGGGSIPTASPDSSGNCPPGYGSISNGTSKTCLKNGTSGDGSGVGDHSGSGSNSGDGSSNCGGSGQPPCGNSPDNGGSCPSGTSQITVDRGKNGTDSVCVPVTDPSTLDTSGLNQSGLVSGYASQPSLNSIPTHDGYTCPAAYDFSVFGSSYSISFEPLCTLASDIKPIVIAAGYITLMILVVSLFRIL